MKNLSECLKELLEESDDSKIKNLEKKLDKVEDKADDAADKADDAADDAADAEKEANKAEESIKDEKSFRDYAENKFKKVFGDKLDKDKMKETVDGLLKKYKDDVDNGDFGKIIGVLNKSFG